MASNLADFSLCIVVSVWGTIGESIQESASDTGIWPKILHESEAWAEWMLYKALERKKVDKLFVEICLEVLHSKPFTK